MARSMVSRKTLQKRTRTKKGTKKTKLRTSRSKAKLRPTKRSSKAISGRRTLTTRKKLTVASKRKSPKSKSKSAPLKRKSAAPKATNGNASALEICRRVNNSLLSLEKRMATLVSAIRAITPRKRRAPAKKTKRSVTKRPTKEKSQQAVSCASCSATSHRSIESTPKTSKPQMNEAHAKSILKPETSSKKLATPDATSVSVVAKSKSCSEKVVSVASSPNKTNSVQRSQSANASTSENKIESLKQSEPKIESIDTSLVDNKVDVTVPVSVTSRNTSPVNAKTVAKSPKPTPASALSIEDIIGTVTLQRAKSNVPKDVSKGKGNTSQKRTDVSARSLSRSSVLVGLLSPSPSQVKTMSFKNNLSSCHASLTKQNSPVTRSSLTTDSSLVSTN